MRAAVEPVCPGCKQSLTFDEASARCDRCDRRYPRRHGVLSFLDCPEEFNPSLFVEKQEHAWSESAQLRDRIRNSRLLSAVNRLRIKYSLSGRRDRIFYNEMRGRGKELRILDIGCGGGRHYFTEYGTVTGVDTVLKLLQVSKHLYQKVYHASATALPFADNTFDYAVSSDVLGHIPTSLKDDLFREMFRVLRPGGRAVHVIETDGTNTWFRQAHRHPELFEKYIVQMPGHISLEMPSALRARFLRHGFREVKFLKFASVVLEVGTVAGMFQNEYAQRSGWLKFCATIDGLAYSNLAVREALNFLLEPLAQAADYFSDFDSANGALVVYEKPEPPTLANPSPALTASA